jgi:acyl carrier protein
MEATIATIRQFILDNYFFANDDLLLDNDDSFLEKSIVDSTGMLELIAFIGSEFGIHVEDDEIIPDNLDSVHKVASFIHRKREAAA